LNSFRSQPPDSAFYRLCGPVGSSLDTIGDACKESNMLVGKNVAGSMPVEAALRRGMSKAAAVYDVLRSEIIDLKREPGTRIDKAEVCDRLGVSRHPVAEALGRLAEERLVEVHPQSGSFVARIRTSDVEEAAFIRRAIESTAVREIARSADRALLDQLDRILGYQAVACRINDVAEFYQLDLRFHASLLAHLGNRRAGEIVEAVRAPLERARRMLLPNPARNQQTLEEHAAIAAALASGDAERAAQAMLGHLAASMEAFHRYAAEHTELFET
jgi:DNA-binding GntR family transcriptional regulator